MDLNIHIKNNNTDVNDVIKTISKSLKEVLEVTPKNHIINFDFTIET